MTNPNFRRLCALARHAAKQSGAKGKGQRKLRDLLVVRTIQQIQQQLAAEHGKAH